MLADEFFDDNKSAACRVPRELQLKQGAQVMLRRDELPLREQHSLHTLANAMLHASPT